MKTTICGYPRIGEYRELKFAIEKYWKKEISQKDLKDEGNKLRKKQWLFQKKQGLSFIPSNTFSFYDMMLDTSVMLNAIPKIYKDLQLNDLDTYFAMARGYQGNNGDVKALSMKKWFNTNYHYLVPELDDETVISLHPEKLISEYNEALNCNIVTRPVVYGPFTFLYLAKTTGIKEKDAYVDSMIKAYSELLAISDSENIEWIQFDEPALVYDLTKEDIVLFEHIYQSVLANKQNVKVLLQTYFGDIKDCYMQVMNLPLDGIGLDFIEGKENKTLLKNNGWKKDKVLFAGLINGKNIWKTSYEKVINEIDELKTYVDDIVLSTSCSLLHVPYTIRHETHLSNDILEYFAYAEEKLIELKELQVLLNKAEIKQDAIYLQHEALFHKTRTMADNMVQQRVLNLTEKDFRREVKRDARLVLQKKNLQLPSLPTTTIGSFPQTLEVKRNRTRLKKVKLIKSNMMKIFSLI